MEIYIVIFQLCHVLLKSSSTSLWPVFCSPVVDEREFECGLLSDPAALQRLLEKPGYHDYVRLGLGSLSLPSSRDRTPSEPFRISTANANYSVCRRSVT